MESGVLMRSLFALVVEGNLQTTQTRADEGNGRSGEQVGGENTDLQRK
jgi:hypothetical protein